MVEEVPDPETAEKCVLKPCNLDLCQEGKKNYNISEHMCYGKVFVCSRREKKV